MTRSVLRAVIFDFNGTLFNDTEFHDEAWMQFARQHGKTLDPHEMEHHVHGFTNREILEYLFARELSDANLEEYSENKEHLYRSICLDRPERCVLAPGAKEFLDTLANKGIPRTIATASVRSNVEFFITLFSLDRWFDTDKIIYDSGKFRGKPHPDMFLAAAGQLGIIPEKCMIIEDSLGGVKAALNAGAGRIVAINDDNNPGKFSQVDFIDQIISDFRQIKFDFTPPLPDY